MSFPCCFAVVRVVVAFLRSCVHFFLQCFLFFSPSYSCVGQALLGRIKIVYVTIFLLMKNVLRHGREKHCFNLYASQLLEHRKHNCL